jgi:hypothetical protein
MGLRKLHYVCDVISKDISVLTRTYKNCFIDLSDGYIHVRYRLAQHEKKMDEAAVFAKLLSEMSPHHSVVMIEMGSYFLTVAKQNIDKYEIKENLHQQAYDFFALEKTENQYYA